MAMGETQDVARGGDAHAQLFFGSQRDWQQAFNPCIQCGMCSGACPLAFAMDYTPRRAIYMAREGLLDPILQSNTLWLCVSCYNCTARCPTGLKITDIFFPALRDAAINAGLKLPSEFKRALDNTYRYGNSLGEGPRKRIEWTKGAGVPVPIASQLRRPFDVLWLVECYPSYHPRNIVQSQAMARVLHALGVDFAILGPEERCVGDCERLSGEKGLFESLVEYNASLFDKYEYGQIITSDPHAYNSLTRVYPEFGKSYPVKHYVQFLAERLDALKPLLRHPVDARVTYHDNCCLGRMCGLYAAPRDLLRAIPGVSLVEMAFARENAMCCGGGGGGMWLDTVISQAAGERLSDRRVGHALATGAGILAVSCPFETSRFEDSLKSTGHESQMVVRDILELLDASMHGREGAAV
ncbi:MAG: (Fe-S)-binding protein [Armatimonadota bacterium]|nr:(Fe-S)-binding protein [Armatimonadota bacterium]